MRRESPVAIAHHDNTPRAIVVNCREETSSSLLAVQAPSSAPPASLGHLLKLVLTSVLEQIRASRSALRLPAQIILALATPHGDGLCLCTPGLAVWVERGTRKLMIGWSAFGSGDPSVFIDGPPLLLTYNAEEATTPTDWVGLPSPSTAGAGALSASSSCKSSSFDSNGEVRKLP